MKIYRKTFWKYINTILLSLIILIAGYALFWPTDVLENSSWKLTVSGDTHYPGEEISVTSSYKKLVEVRGEARRYIDCLNPDKAYVRYPINQADANRTPGNKATGIALVIPTSIPAPSKCKIIIDIKYDLNFLRKHGEYNESPIFDLIERPSTLIIPEKGK